MGETVTLNTPDDVKEHILGLISDGYSLKLICEGKDSKGDTILEVPSGMVVRSTVYEWLAKDKEFSDKYTRAREEQAEKFAQEIVEIADTEKDPQKAKIRIDARKWVASKLKGSLYGDKQQIDHTSKGDKISNNVNMMTDEQLQSLINGD